jgi:hypothetical protein
MRKSGVGVTGRSTYIPSRTADLIPGAARIVASPWRLTTSQKRYSDLIDPTK